MAVILGSVWTSLARALGMKVGSGDRQTLITKHITDLQDPNPEVRRSACWSLGKMRPPAREAIQRLQEVAETDRVEFVTKAARWALKRIYDSR